MPSRSRVKLPSERTREGSPTAVGYQHNPSSVHLDQLSAMLADVADRVDMPPSAEAVPLRVCLSMVRLPLGLPMQLFYFPITRVDDEGEPALPNWGDEVTVAFVANQPLPLLREVSLRFLLDLVGRTAPVAEVIQERRGIQDLPDMVAESDAEAGLIAWETLSYDWTRAADVIRERAAAQGFSLHVRHAPDPFPTHKDVTRRLRALRRLYREEDRVREWVDYSVAGVVDHDWHMRGGNETVRLFAQQQTATAGMRQFLAQAFRDARVCGNGYLRPEMAALDMGIRCLRPEAVEILGDGTLVEHAGSASSRRLGPETMHFRGVEQQHSRYGMSALEPLLFVLEQRRVAEMSQALAASAPPHLEPLLTRRFGNSKAAAEMMLSDLESRIIEHTGILELAPRAIPDDLYLPGQELL